MTESKRARLSQNALTVLTKRYLKRDENGNVIESPEEMFHRVADFVAQADPEGVRQETANRFYQIMWMLDFLPNSPAFNAGILGNLSACFVLPLEDSMESIFDTIKEAALIHKEGGGTGFAFSKIRPANDLVGSTKRSSSGPISFLTALNATTEVVKQGGCFPGETLIATAEGPIPIKDLKAGMWLYCWGDEGFQLAQCTDPWLTRANTEVWRVETDKGLTFFATPDHPVLERWSIHGSKKQYTKVSDLKPGVSLVPLSRSITDGEWRITLQDGKDTRVVEHQWMAQQVGWECEDKHVHHVDGDHSNNVLSNLVVLTKNEHAILHGKERFASGEHPFSRLTQEQKDASVVGWKEWFTGLSDQERVAYEQKIRDGVAGVNEQRIEKGAHNFVNDPPMRKEDSLKKKMQACIASAMWKVRSLGISISKDSWFKAVKDAGLYRTQQYSMDTINKFFGSWEAAEEYLNENNHRVVSVGPSHTADVYNVEVPGPHNFVVCDENRRGVVVSNSRRGANMAVLSCDHPDVMDFITCKQDTSKITNFNISVAITDAFMAALKADVEYPLINPRTKEITQTVRAREVFDAIVRNAWATGEPGLLFEGRANSSRSNPVPSYGPIMSSNPCGEQLLYSRHDSCNLGSINLANFVVDGQIDMDRLDSVVRDSIHFLDNVIDVNQYPVAKITETTKNLRRIGLGVMGWADLLYLMEIPYNSEEALSLAESLMVRIQKTAESESHRLALERGAFPLWEVSIYNPLSYQRHAALTTVAPTGTISMIAGCSGGIEPNFAISFVRNQAGVEMTEVNPIFEAVAKREGFYSEDLMKLIAKRGSCFGISEVPKKWQRVFVTSHDISPEWHVRMQAAFQKHIDNAVSKTINMPHDATVEDVEKAYMLAWDLGCKGVTVYRDGSRPEQVLNIEKVNRKEEKGKAFTEFAAKVGGVPTSMMAVSADGDWSPELAKDEPFPQEKLEKFYKQVDATYPAPRVTPLPDAFAPSPGEPRERPTVVSGKTYRYDTGEGAVFVTCNSDQHGPLEVFVQIGKAGGATNANVEALGRLVSLALRCGLGAEAVIEQLKGIRSETSTWNNGEMVLSCPDAVAKAMTRYLNETPAKRDEAFWAQAKKEVAEMKAKATESVVFAEPKPVEIPKSPESWRKTFAQVIGKAKCVECSSTNTVKESGCLKCLDCGWSKCG